MGKPEQGSYLMQSDANDNPLYEGWAKRKMADMGAAVWKIKKHIWGAGTGGGQVYQEAAWADGNELYDNIWENRATTVTYGTATT